MSRSRPQITVRRLMVGVAIVALILGIATQTIRLRRKSAEYGARAAWHETQAKSLTGRGDPIYRARERLESRLKAERKSGIDPMGYLNPGGTIPANRAMVSRLNDLRNDQLFRWEWHRRMRSKYETAARYPWLPVIPDTPEP